MQARGGGESLTGEFGALRGCELHLSAFPVTMGAGLAEAGKGLSE